MIDSRRRYSLAAHSSTIFSSWTKLSRTPRNLYCFPSSSDGNLPPAISPPKFSWEWIPLLIWTTAHFLGFHCSPMSSIATCVDSSTQFNLVSLAANTLRSSIYNRSVTVALIGLDNLYPSEALIFQATGFKQIVKSLGQSASPCGSPFLNIIGSDTSHPCRVLATILVFQLLHNLLITLHSHFGNLCSTIISPNHPWSTESYAFFTSTHAILRLRLLL